MNYGVFINTIISLIIVAFAVFVVIRNINKLKREEEPTPAPQVTTKDCPYCLSTVSIKAVRCLSCTSNIEA